MQGMIRDLWGTDRNNLNQELIEIKDKVPIELYNTLDALRELGNVGAHPEKKY